MTKMIQLTLLHIEWILHLCKLQMELRNVNSDKYNLKYDRLRTSEVCWFINQIRESNYISSETILNLSTLPLNVNILCLNASEIDFNQDVSIFLFLSVVIIIIHESTVSKKRSNSNLEINIYT